MYACVRACGRMRAVEGGVPLFSLGTIKTLKKFQKKINENYASKRSRRGVYEWRDGKSRGVQVIEKGAIVRPTKKRVLLLDDSSIFDTL